jgi:small subunit ribosomal protein S18
MLKNPSHPRKGQLRTKQCPFTKVGLEYIDYKDVNTLNRFTNDQGKILPRRVTGVSAKHQRQLTRAVKRARHLGLLSFVAENLR